MIRVIFKHELHKKVYDEKFKQEFSNSINKFLESIKNDIIKYNGCVEIVETKDGNYYLNALCENKEIEESMQELLNNITS